MADAVIEAKQAVVELRVSQDGGGPLVSKSWDGNTSDTQVFQKRAEALLRACKDTPTPRSLIADAKLYCEDSAAPLAQLGFITRMPATLKVVSQVIGQALQEDTWQTLDDNTRYQPLEWCHYGRAQRGLVVYSQAAFDGAKAALDKAKQRDYEALTSSSFTCKPTAFALPKPRRMPSQRWPSAGSITTWSPRH